MIESNVAQRKEAHKDPQEAIREAYQQMIAQLSDIKRLMGEVAAELARLEEQIAELSAQLDALEKEAERCVADGDDEGARAALGKRRKLQERLAGLKMKAQATQRKLKGLQDARALLREQVDDFQENRDEKATRLAAANADVLLKKASAAIDSATKDALDDISEQVRIVEAQAELNETIDEQLERLKNTRG